ncbi:hypothetical protein COU58_00745 [Candidatus Pacearchaeota archaeon CG10_big_fil_rev_8_21_14_0_10_32_42]|nr:MAG: hypothetical protein COU58_00745 [Candidatus Pacearchaeota archaeon CG10_big_fil_rev_8_21_14_0_10_32_42]
MIEKNYLKKNELDRYEKIIENYENIGTTVLNKEVFYLNQIYHKLIRIGVEKQNFKEKSNSLLWRLISVWNKKNLTIFERKKDLNKIIYSEKNSLENKNSQEDLK